MENTITVDIRSLSLNFIDIIIDSGNENRILRGSGFYGFPEQQNKFRTCDLIRSLSQSNFNQNWILFGDFNLILSQDKKLGGNLANTNHIDMFRKAIPAGNLSDLGYEGDKYTWSNNQDGTDHIKARLDRFLATPKWKISFLEFLFFTF